MSGVHGAPWRPIVCQRWRPSAVRYFGALGDCSALLPPCAKARHSALAVIPDGQPRLRIAPTVLRVASRKPVVVSRSSNHIATIETQALAMVIKGAQEKLPRSISYNQYVIEEKFIPSYPGKSKQIHGAAFRRQCREIKIEDLHFHDLRHEGTRRLFEAGFTIEQVALVTGHKDWKMLRSSLHEKSVIRAA